MDDANRILHALVGEDVKVATSINWDEEEITLYGSLELATDQADTFTVSRGLLMARFTAANLKSVTWEKKIVGTSPSIWIQL